MWQIIVTLWSYVDWCAGVLGWIGGSCALALAVANTFRLNRMDSERVELDQEVDGRLYRLEQDAGIGPGGSWAERAVERTRH